MENADMNHPDDWTFHPPDWKDRKNYPAPEKMTDPEWGWEFLRRNPDFQKEGQELRDLFRKLAGTDKPNEIFKWHIQQREGGMFERIYLTDSQGWDRPFVMKAGGVIGRDDLQRKLRSFSDKWGVDSIPLVTHATPNTPFHYLHDGAWGRPRLLPAGETFRPSPLPAVPIPDRLNSGPSLPFYSGVYFGISALDDLPNRGPEEASTRRRFPAQIALVFDLREGWRSQAAEAKEIFKEIHAWLKNNGALMAKKNFQRGNFQRYLRTLDAKQSGATNAEINKILLKGEKRIRATEEPDLNFHNLVRDTFEAARQIRDSDFRLLLSS